jgi:hypothetical protein
MSWEKHDDNCEGCRPALIDAATGQVMPDDSQIMRAVSAMWQGTTLAERQAFHRFTCLNSRDPADLAIVGQLNERIHQAALASN